MDILFFILLLICLLILTMLVLNVNKRVGEIESTVEKHSKEYAIKTNKAEGLLYNLKERLDRLERRQKDVINGLNTTNDRLNNINNVTDILIGIVSKEAQIGENREERKEELLIASSYGIIDINDNEKNPLLKFTLHDRFDREIRIGLNKIELYDEVEIKEVYIQSGQEVRKGEKIARISFRSNPLMIKSSSTGVILNIVRKASEQFYIEKGEELLLLKDENGAIIRLLSPLNGVLIANCELGDLINKDSNIFKAYIKDEETTTTNTV